MENFSTFNFLYSGLATDSTMILPQSEPSIHSSFNEADGGHISVIDSYAPFFNTYTQFSPINPQQQASTLASTLDLSPHPTMEPSPMYSFQNFEAINPLFRLSPDFSPSLTSGRVSTPDPCRIFPEDSCTSATYPPTFCQAPSSMRQSQSLENFGEYTSVDVTDGHLCYPPTSSTGVAPTNVQHDRYVNIAHGGIWFADTDPSTQVAKTLTRVDTEDRKQKRQLLPTLESVEQLVSYYLPGSHASLPGSSSNSFHFHIGEKETHHKNGSTQWTSNREVGSGGDPVEPFAGPTHKDGGMANHLSATRNGDRQVSTASRYTRKRRLSTADNDGSKSAPAAKRPRKRSPRDPLRDQKAGEGRVARALTAAPTRRPHRKPATPRCMAGAVSEGHVVVHDRERHSKKGKELTFQVMSAVQRP
ncbi:hypothetical protein JR316_0013402 [Psilocybe cubensis]|uniref:Uncharacterized protein n=2 Tax=Psilocybe cubensis TaxID=181762 RepID=A0ACB8GFK8_PSICU|nr:uncharacterized protein JR316_0013402 [Psilocybe cubensis]KAH9474239.1 hypothetical protein JR316_0013402 [Psilocybe cubensis]